MKPGKFYQVKKNKKMNKVYKYATPLLLGLLLTSNIYASDYKLIVRLSGYWKFSIGNDPKWSDPNYDDSNWDQIYAPADWEKNGYNDYNGYAWYRKKFDVYNAPENATLYLMVGKIDDVDEVYLNGVRIGQTGEFPPMYKKAWDIQRRYIIPNDLLNKNGQNVIAVKVYDGIGQGGIRSGDLGIFMDSDYNLMDISLQGNWKFNLGNRREWRDPEYDASKWDEIIVPASWESQGYSDYDGYACYRKEVVIPTSMKNQNKYLSLGKIDDIDEVYFNGKYIGTVYDLFGRYDYRRNGQEYAVQRVYYIPNELIRYGQKNVITVVVYDGQSRGGIYDGPVGIINEYNYTRLMERRNEPSTVWELLYEWLVE